MSFLWGCVYSNVRLRGWIGGVLHRWMLDAADMPNSVRFLTHNLELYSSIEVALDITQARFTFLQVLIGVPARAVLKNPDWHYVLADSGARRIVDDETADASWKLMAKELLERGLPDVVVALGEASKNARRDKEVADALKTRDILS